jgi:DNA-binding CsgD family transcriptional regulator
MISGPGAAIHAWLLVRSEVVAYRSGMLLGRRAEQDQLDLLLRRARAGTSGVLVLRGDPGIGKTALLSYAAECAQSMRILWATGIETEKELAFAGLYSLLRPLVDHLGSLPERHAAAVRAALGLSKDQVPPERLAVAAGTHGVLGAAAENGALLLLVDDLHWLDSASLEALTFALRRLDSDAIACVMTTRSGAAGPPGLPRRDIAGLGYEAAGRLIEDVAGLRPVPAVVRRLHAETGGNPLALVELSAVLTPEQLAGAEMLEMPLEPGAAIRQRFAERLHQLSPPTRAALVVAAAAPQCPAALVTAAAEHIGGGASQALGEAESAGVIRITSQGVEFSHPLLRSVAYHTAAPALRRAAHRALAEVLTNRDAERAAWHRAAAATGPDEAAAAALDAAAVLAARKGAPLAAATAWERAAALSTFAERSFAWLADAAEAALEGGDLDRARRLTQTVPAVERTRPRARMLAVRGRVERLTGKVAAAQRSLREAAELRADADPPQAVELLAESVDAALEAGLFDVASQAAERMDRLAERSDGAARFRADFSHSYLGWRRGDADHGRARLRQAVARLDANPAIATNPGLLGYIVWALDNAGDSERASRYCDQAVELARSAGAVSRLADLLPLTASRAVSAGRWSLVLADAGQALDLAQAAGQTLTTCEALLLLATVEAAQGRDVDCVRHVREADRLTGELGLSLLQLGVRRSLALLELGQGKLDQAVTHYEEVRRLAASQGFADAFTSPIPDLIEAYARADAIDQARALLPEYLALVTGDTNPEFAAIAARCRGIVAADVFDAYFLDAIRLHERSPDPFQHARTHLYYGERLRRARRRRDARAQLRAALEIFDRLDARPWAERARAELRATGETMTNPRISGEQLTPQELQIALLVSQGRTNAEVGQAVFLSTRTVEFHLSRAYRKLGVASRTELTHRLASAGVVPG